MPRPRITEPEIPRFEDALVSLQGFASLEKVPRIFWIRINELIARDKKPIHEACDAIAHLVNSNRDQVKARLNACQPKNKDLLLNDRPSRPEPWPSIKNAQKHLR